MRESAISMVALGDDGTVRLRPVNRADLPREAGRRERRLWLVRMRDLRAIRAALGERAGDIRLLAENEQPARAMVGRKVIPLVAGRSTDVRRLMNSMTTILRHARTADEPKLYVFGIADGVFDDFVRAKRALLTGTERSAAADGATMLAQLPAAEDIESELAERMPGASEVIRETRRLMAHAVAHPGQVWFVGEPGTGKELAARTIHELRRSRMDLQSRDTASFEILVAPRLGPGELARRLRPKGLLDSPDAKAWPHAERLPGDTVFIDEIEALTPADQGVLLTALRAIVRDPHRPRARVMGAMRRSLSAKVAEGVFDEDLYYRFWPGLVAMPSLRERPADIPEMAAALWREVTDGQGRPLAEATVRLLQEQRWPGNVRELKAVLESVWTMFRDVEATPARLRAVLRYAGLSLRPSAAEALAAQRLDAVQHLRRVEDAVNACRVVLNGFAGPGGRAAGRTALTLARARVPRIVSELEALCRTPSLFGSHAVFAAVHGLLGRLVYLRQELQMHPRAAAEFCRTELAGQADALTPSLIEAIGALAGI